MGGFLFGWFQKLWYPKMDGENNGKTYFLMDDLGVPLFSETPILIQDSYMKLFCFAMVFFGLRLTPKARTVPGTLMKFS